jgi:hypothetical protein
MSLSVRSGTQDVARQLLKLGVPAKALEDPKALAKALPPEKKALLEALGGFSKGELSALRKEMESPGAAGAARKAEAFAPRAGVGGAAGANRFALQALFDAKPTKTADAPLPKNVQHMVDVYFKETPDIGRPLERLMGCVAQLHTLLNSETKVDKLVDELCGHDARRNVFQLEGFLKLYKGHLSKDVETSLSVVKELEDALGNYTVRRDIRKSAEDKGAPAAVVKHLKTQEKAGRQELERLVEKEWMPQGKHDRSPALKDILRSLADEKWGSYGEDMKYIRSRMSDHLHKVDTTHYDMRQLDSGIHELRRNMRWIPLYIEALGGVVQLSEAKNPVAELRQTLDTPMAQHKNAQLPQSDREEDPIRISKSVYVGFLQAVEDLGQVKDRGEVMEILSHAYVEAGVSKNENDARAAVARLLGKKPADFDLTDDAKKIYDGMRATGLLNAMRKEFAAD